jgi:hypothetical protein
MRRTTISTAKTRLSLLPAICLAALLAACTPAGAGHNPSKEKTF